MQLGHPQFADIVPNGVLCLNTFMPRQNDRHFANILKCISLNEIVWISLKISRKFVPKFQVNSIPALVHIMAWCRPGDKQLSEAMIIMVYWRIYASLRLSEFW